MSRVDLIALAILLAVAAVVATLAWWVEHEARCIRRLYEQAAEEEEAARIRAQLLAPLEREYARFPANRKQR